MTSSDFGVIWFVVQTLPVHPAAPGAVGEIDIVCLQTQGRCALAMQLRLAPSPLGTVVTGTLPGCSFPAIAPSPTQAPKLLAGPPTSQATYRRRTRTATRAPSKELREAERSTFALYASGAFLSLAGLSYGSWRAHEALRREPSPFSDADAGPASTECHISEQSRSDASLELDLAAQPEPRAAQAP